jgi:glycosyltransferase involved in cell wall biosynthesis
MKNLMVFGIPCKSIVTINDLTHVVLADLFPWIDKVYWQVIQRAMLKSVDHVITISENTKQDVVQTYGLDEQKVSAIYPACGSSFHPVRDHDQEKQLWIKYGMSGPIILYVGGWAVHKNLQTIIAAYAQVSNRVSHDLVIVGGKHHTSSDTRLDAWINELNLVGRVHLLGTVPDSEMPHLYRMADLFVLPSLNEGFGLALLEAMASGTPALASRCSSLPEVGGDAVAWVQDPKNVREWSQALETLLNDVPRRKRLLEAGLEKAKTFSWDETARQTLALYEQVMRY